MKLINIYTGKTFCEQHNIILFSHFIFFWQSKLKHKMTANLALEKGKHGFAVIIYHAEYIKRQQQSPNAVYDIW